MLTLYGLKNCDTCRKAVKWLTAESIAHTFKDLRKEGVDQKTIKNWADAVGWETLLNRRGTTWRGLPEIERDTIDAVRSVALMAQYPALMKRPIFDQSGIISVGFKDTDKTRFKS